MARLARVVVPGIPHHITQRGVRSVRIIFSDQDRTDYLQLLGHYSEIYGLHLASYTLMDNFHLIGIPDREESIRKGVGTAHWYYTRGINFRQGKRGYLFQGRPFSSPLDDDHFLAALGYVERNPVRAKMVAQAWQYEWSSARYHVGVEEKTR
jgi:REP-associated tyrosine transposase